MARWHRNYHRAAVGRLVPIPAVLRVAKGQTVAELAGCERLGVAIHKGGISAVVMTGHQAGGGKVPKWIGRRAEGPATPRTGGVLLPFAERAIHCGARHECGVGK